MRPLHYKQHVRGRLVHGEHGHDVRVPERRQHAHLVAETAQPFRLPEVLRFRDHLWEELTGHFFNKLNIYTLQWWQ